MTQVTIQIPDKDTDLVLQLLEKLNVTIVASEEKSENVPNQLTAQVIEDARKRKGLDEPIKDVKSFMSSL